MTAVNQNFRVFAGDTHELIVSIPNVDLTGVKIKWAMMQSVGHKHLIYRESPANITIDIATGEFKITIEPKDTAELRGSYYHEAELTDAQGHVSTIMTGTVSIIQSGV